MPMLYAVSWSTPPPSLTSRCPHRPMQGAKSMLLGGTHELRTNPYSAIFMVETGAKAAAQVGAGGGKGAGEAAWGGYAGQGRRAHAAAPLPGTRWRPAHAGPPASSLMRALPAPVPLHAGHPGRRPHRHRRRAVPAAPRRQPGALLCRGGAFALQAARRSRQLHQPERAAGSAGAHVRVRQHQHPGAAGVRDAAAAGCGEAARCAAAAGWLRILHAGLAPRAGGGGGRWSEPCRLPRI